MISDDPNKVKTAADSDAGGAAAEAAGASASVVIGDAGSAAPDGAQPSGAEKSTSSKPAAIAAQAAEIKPAAAKPAAAKPAPAPKAAPPPPEPYVPKPSMPVSMIASPGEAKPRPAGTSRFPGELEADFETALRMVTMAPSSRSIGARLSDAIARLIGRRGAADYARVRRVVAFDGFRTNLHDEKLERDRRYGTVYTVNEEVNAYLVRLEMPRRMPNSSLRRTWNLPDEMPDYDYSLNLRDGVLAIRAGVPNEACRRLSYVSPSFPADFLTRIEFGKPVSGFQHRLRNKVLEIIVFKRDENFRSAA